MNASVENTAIPKTILKLSLIIPIQAIIMKEYRITAHIIIKAYGISIQ
jgi:hypothetical protein